MPPAKHILCLYLPHWSITRYTRRHPEFQQAPVIIVQAIGQRRVVVDASNRAASSGVHCGMSAAEAKALCPHLHCVDQNLPADERALDALGRWLNRFTPVVARASAEDETFLHAALFLDLTGCERLFHGIGALVERVTHALQGFNIPARLAVAPTPGATWALAFTNPHNAPILVEDDQFRAVLHPLPVVTLRLDPAILADLHRLGLQCIGDLIVLPRDQLPARFGPTLLKRLDQLFGVLPEPLTKLVTDPPVTSRMEFDAPIEALEDIWLIFEKLLDLVLTDLARRHHGVRRLRMIFKPDRGWGRETEVRAIALSRPHRDRATLLNLLRCETERVDCDHGFVRFQLDVPAHEPVAEAQTQLFEQQFVEEQMEMDRLLQRLRVRLGEAAVIRPQGFASYLPERAWKPAGGEETTASFALLSPRPLTLFPTPIEIRVVSEPSDDRTGEPRQFTWQGRVHRLTHVVGPERIAGEWWRGHRRTRDYYEVEDEVGRRFWLFRVLHAKSEDVVVARWFLHGLFN